MIRRGDADQPIVEAATTRGNKGAGIGFRIVKDE